MTDSPAITRRKRAAALDIPVPALLFVVSAAIYAGTAVATGHVSALSPEGVAGLLQRMVTLGLVGLGQTFAILVASIDLSVASLVSVVAVVTSFIMQGDPAMIAPAIAAAFAIAASVGVVNGVLVAYAGINPLIATLGTGLILQGVLSASFTHLSGTVAPQYQVLAYGRFGGLPYSVAALALLTLLAWFCLSKTRYGARIYAVGGNPEGARLAGLHTERVILGAHVVTSLCAGLAGLYLAARLQSGTPWVGRDGVYDLESIAVTVIGGTILAGGRGGVVGTIAGVLLFASLDASFNMLGIDAFIKQVLRGAIVVAAVAAYAVRNKGHVA